LQFQPIKYRKIRQLRRKLQDWHNCNPVFYPWRCTKNHWHAIVAEIMLQRTKAEQVVPIYESFIKRFPTPESFLKLYKKEVNIFENLGLPHRNQFIYETARTIINKGIPTIKSDLLKFPGIGDYVASAFLSFHLNMREALIDSNIVRFYGRYWGFDYDGETRRKKWLLDLAKKMTPIKEPGEFNYALLDFSMRVCMVKPYCHNCPVSRNCKYYSL
jgi:A/G-specific adenine glycosylase